MVALLIVNQEDEVQILYLGPKYTKQWMVVRVVYYPPLERAAT